MIEQFDRGLFFAPDRVPSGGDQPIASRNDVFVWRDGLARDVLPIDGRLGEILNEFDTHQVVVVEAETGAGKTTRIPQALLNADPTTHVYMTQTRRVAVSMNGERIADEMGSDPGDVVGWKLRGEDNMISDKTRLTLMVDQTLVNTIRREKKLPKGVLIIDEAHERSVSTDLLLGLIKKYLPESPDTKVLITSATIDTQKFTEYFEGSTSLSVKGRMYPVELREPHRLARYEHHSEGAIEAVLKVVEEYEAGELTIPPEKEEDPRTCVREGSVAVLLPGKEDIRQMVERIQFSLQQKNITNVDVVTCHGESTREETKKIKVPTTKSTLRIVVATEVLRSSVTVPDLVGVVDALQVKRFITDSRGVAHLDKIAVSKAEADQAKGRAGRVRPGFYIPISFGHEYENLDRWPTPAIKREPLSSVVLQVAAIGESVRIFPFIDRPEEDRIGFAVTRLQKIGALDTEEKITPLGEKLLHLPLDPERARIVLRAEEFDVLPEAILVTAVMENEGIQFVPKKEAECVVDESLLRRAIQRTAGKVYGTDGQMRQPTADEIDISKLPSWATRTKDGKFLIKPDYSFDPSGAAAYGAQWLAREQWKIFADESGSDFVAAANAVRAYKQYERSLRDRNRNVKQGEKKIDVDRSMGDWCREHFLNAKKMSFVLTTLRQIEDDVSAAGITLTENIYTSRKFSSESLTKALASGLVDFVLKRDRSGRREGYSGAMTREYGICEVSKTSACTSSGEYILIGGVRKIATPKSLFYVAEMAVPIQPEWIMEVMPQMCEATISPNSIVFEPSTGNIVGNKITRYSGIDIDTARVIIDGEIARKHLADAMMMKKTGHPAEAINETYIKEWNDMCARIGVGTDEEKRMKFWYVKTLGDAINAIQVKEIDLTMTDEKMNDLVGFDFREFQKFVKQLRPDVMRIENVDVPIRYQGYGGVRFTISEELLGRVQISNFPAWEGMQISVEVPDETNTYNTLSSELGSLEALKERVEVRRLSNAWSTFENSVVLGEKKREFGTKLVGSPPTLLPEPEIWDEITGVLAYPSLKRSTHHSEKEGEPAWVEWRIEWHKTQDEARRQTEHYQKQFTELVDQEYNRKNAVELKAKFTTLSAEISDLRDKIDFSKGSHYGFSEEEAAGYGQKEIERRIEKSLRPDDGFDSYYSNKRQIVSELEALKLRLTEAQTYFDENPAYEAQAREAYRNLDDRVRDVEQKFGRPISSLTAAIHNMARQIEDRNFHDAFDIGESTKKELQPLQERIKRADAGQILLSPVVAVSRSKNSREWEDVWVISSDGSIIDPLETDERVSGIVYDDLLPDVLIVTHGHSNYGYQNQEHWRVEHKPAALTDAQKEKIGELSAQRKYFTGRGTGWDLSRVGENRVETPYSRDFTGREKDDHDDMVRQMYESPIDVGQWRIEEGEGGVKTVIHNRILDPREEEIRTLEMEISELDEEQARLLRDQDEAKKRYAAAEMAHLERAVEDDFTQEIADGVVIEVDEFEEVNLDGGKKSIQTKPLFDRPSGKRIVLILDPYDKATKDVELGEKLLVAIRQKSREQLHLFQGKIPSGTGKRVDISGYFVRAILSPAKLQPKIDELQKQIEELNQKKEALGNK
ncbi:ATP-dependent RNA helicase [Candidatus Gottesmanbacteria bacterium]|nr:ATP-dependent RNA helicase [Candidatus Gottesmanbacteria bacterium]